MINGTHELIRDTNLFKYSRVILEFNRNKLTRVIIVYREDQQNPIVLPPRYENNARFKILSY